MTDWKTTTLGKTRWKVGRLGRASSYGADERGVQMAFEQGVNYLYWGSMRTARFGAGLRSLRSRRDEFRLVIQSYSRTAAMVPWSLERALKSLGMDHADILLLGLWNKKVSPAIFDQALRLRERGLIHAIAVSTHNRPQAAVIANHSGDVGVLHVRYNAVHPGAERDIFPNLPSPEVRPGIVAFTATCWGDLMKPDKVPTREKIPSAGDCYRFNLTNPAVDLCLTCPRSVADLTPRLTRWTKAERLQRKWTGWGGSARPSTSSHACSPSKAKGVELAVPTMSFMAENSKRALLVIDVQNEYFAGKLPITCPAGSLASVLSAVDAASV